MAEINIDEPSVSTAAAVFASSCQLCNGKDHTAQHCPRWRNFKAWNRNKQKSRKFGKSKGKLKQETNRASTSESGEEDDDDDDEDISDENLSDD